MNDSTDNTERNGNIIMLVTIGIMLAVALILYPSLPEELPRQWGIGGEVNSTWHKFYAVSVMPIIALLIWVGTYILPKVDPRRESYEKFGGFYMRFRVTLVVFILGVHIVTLTQYDNPDAVVRLIFFGIGAILAVLGNELGRVRQTWFFGIRTPWTLADERVWKRTHRIGGRWFVAVGVLNMLTSLMLPEIPMFIIFMVSVLGISLGLMAYSYVLHRRFNG